MHPDRAQNPVKALEDSRPAVEAGLAEAEQELSELNDRRRELERLIARARAVLVGDEPQTDPGPEQRLTLREAMELVLNENQNRQMTVHELADEINRRNFYEKRDRSPIDPSQIHARANNTQQGSRRMDQRCAASTRQQRERISVLRPSAVLHIPHSSTVVPDGVRDSLVLSDVALERELLRLTDRYTDELFDLDPAIATPILFGVSRLVVDPERFIDDALEPMAARAMGAVYTATTDSAALRAGLTESQRAELLARFYAPHHAALEAATQVALDATGRCLIIDCHSFPCDPLPCDLNQEPQRPEICVGTDAFHTPAQLAAEAVAGFSAHRLDVAVDHPYTGAVVPSRWYQRDDRVSAVMVEINRRLYMDEATGEKTAGFAPTMAVVQSVLTALIQRHVHPL